LEPKNRPSHSTRRYFESPGGRDQEPTLVGKKGDQRVNSSKQNGGGFTKGAPSGEILPPCTRQKSWGEGPAGTRGSGTTALRGLINEK